MTRLPLPVARLSGRPTPTLHGRFQLTFLSASLAMTLGLASLDASALSLGRLNVQSALGEPLRAEIDVTEATAEEIFGLKVSIASEGAFRAAGVPFNAALSDIRTSLQRRADGRYVVRLTSNRSLSEPFIDLLLEASWNSGRVVRDYTVLLDPPANRTAAAPVAPVAPQISATPAARAPVIVGPSARQRPEPSTQPASAPQVARTGRTDQQITVRQGDTASKIAAAYKPADVSLDQMLVALLRANPSAFIAGNINRVKAGAVLDVPTAPQASAIPADEARRTVTAQSRDFGDYRRRLAENAPASQVAQADRRVSGKVQTNVEDRNASNSAADRLRISQGGAAAAQSEEQLAKTRQAEATNARVAELSKNITDLNRLQAGNGSSQAAANSAAGPASTAPPPAVTSPTAAPTAPVSIPSNTAAPSGATPAGSETAAQPAPQPAAPAAIAPTAATPTSSNVAPAAPAAAERGLFADLLDSPLVLGAAALIALLIAFLLYRVLGRKRVDAGDSVFLESRMPKDSFFGASGGESVDTKDRGNSAMSSLSYSPSQLDAGDVDPVAEADVYLAYGRDLQAEEILREALRVNPERTAIHLKLLEIHSKRRDLRSFEALATDVQKLTGGTGTEWNRVVEMGKELDPGNPLYEAGSRDASPAEVAAFAGTLAAASTVAAAAPAPARVPARLVDEPTTDFGPSVAPLDFDLDLTEPTMPAPVAPEMGKYSASNPPGATSPHYPLPHTETQSPTVRTFPSTTREPFSTPTAAASPAPATTAVMPPLPTLDLNNDFDTAPGALDEPTTRAPLRSDDEFTQPATLRAGLPGDSGFIEFDMSSLAGLSNRQPADTEVARLDSPDESTESPHAIKLSLARELKELGDIEGARSLVEEVAAESSGDVNVEAKQLLGQLR